MSSILLAVHSDDEALFACYICMAFKPLVVVVTDGEYHDRTESEKACIKMGVSVRFLGIPETGLTEDLLREALLDYRPCKVFAPAVEIARGNVHHDLVGKVAGDMFGNKVVYYSTYEKTRLYPAGDILIDAPEQGRVYKDIVLNCYKSQLERNKPHFDAVRGRPECLVL
jgi:LmbE family N-acetylglucosaminyl deacetylase